MLRAGDEAFFGKMAGRTWVCCWQKWLGGVWLGEWWGVVGWDEGECVWEMDTMIWWNGREWWDMVGWWIMVRQCIMTNNHLTEFRSHSSSALLEQNFTVHLKSTSAYSEYLNIGSTVSVTATVGSPERARNPSVLGQTAAPPTPGHSELQLLKQTSG